MTNNTKGPFTIMFDTEEGWQVLGENMAIVATLGSDDIESGDPVEQDARRIAACLNACQGLDTETIESRGIAPRFDAALQFKDTGNVVFGEAAAVKQVAELIEERDDLARWKEIVSNASLLQQLRDKAERERDELLALAEEALKVGEWLAGGDEKPNGLNQRLRAAIAKVNGTGPRYTSISKGGSYVKLGAIRGAGSLKGLAGIAYQNEKGDLFIREPECFAKRMVPIEKGPKA